MANSILFVRIDADNVGDKIELSLLNGNVNDAQDIHNVVQRAMADLRLYISSNLGVIIMQGCDDILFRMVLTTNAHEVLEVIRSEFLIKTGFTLSVGIGWKVASALENLRIAKLSGKNKIVGEIN